MADDVNNPKKITPSTIGLTTLPMSIPIRIHSLFNGKRILLLINEISRNINDVMMNAYDQDRSPE